MNKKRNLNDDAPQEIIRSIWKDIEISSYNVNTVDNYGATDLMAACYLHDTKLVEKLLSMKADVNIVDKMEQNAVTMIVFGANNSNDIKESIHLLQLLKSHHPNVNQRDLSGIAPLALSCIYDNGELIQKLISMKADINNVDKSGKTALSLACSNKKIDAIYCICMTALNSSDIKKFRNQIKDVPANIATRYTDKILNSIGLNLSLAKSLSIKKDISLSKI